MTGSQGTPGPGETPAILLGGGFFSWPVADLELFARVPAGSIGAKTVRSNRRRDSLRGMAFLPWLGWEWKRGRASAEPIAFTDEVRRPIRALGRQAGRFDFDPLARLLAS